MVTIVYNYLFLFVLYSTIGWTMEVIVSLIHRHRFINRGFLIGPSCPIYGVGGLVITIFLSKYMNDFLVFFVMTVLTCSILEYMASFIMEKVFHARWWDYSDKLFNLNGRICMETSISFGVVGSVMAYILNPLFMKLINSLPRIVVMIIVIISAILYMIDVFFSNKIMENLKDVNFGKRDNTEEITKKVKATFERKNVFTKRIVEAFPNFEVLRRKTREKINKTKDEIKKKQKEIRKIRKKLIKKEKDIKKLNKRGGKK